ncbi:hypothetical protein GALAXY_54 [Arthrobacter phage Galaxy]|uniref:Uncharacterized protein n=1 Tax=Arthrobacter phage Galaxy TaxID=1772326 RepID=A0A0U4JXM6_9CAUD|nr:terminase small subunit [Arthrobacter phage Galaxy]ALY08898.1 hypothetical protein GALAXY_54 [Arthrobacter phage Galaxy]
MSTEQVKAPARRRATKAPAAPVDPPAPEFPAPAHLDPDAAAVWAEVVAAHHDPGRIVGPDLEAYCGQVAMVRDARRRIATEGTIIADERGKPEPHPAIALERAAQKEVREWGDKFRGRPKREPAERRPR